jgi:hypothetical protein
MNSSCGGLKLLCGKKYSCEDKKNAIKYLCSTVWNRDGTILYENPDNEPGAYKGLQLFESPVENKHVDENCNHYTGYALQGLSDETNDSLNSSGGTFFTTSIDGYQWSRQSYSASWNEKNSQFDCKLTDLDDKSNYSFTLSMNNPKLLNWVGYETNTISINPNNLAEGDSGFSAAGYFIALPEDSTKNYPSYETVYERAGWGGTTKKGLEYFETILRTEPLVIGKEEPLDDKDILVDGASDYNTKVEITGLETILMKVNIDGIDHLMKVFVKYDQPIALTNSKNRQIGKCVFCFHDGISNSLKSINGQYLAIYTDNGETSIEIKVGGTSNPIVQLKINSSLSINVDYVYVQALKLPIVIHSENFPDFLLKVPKTTLTMLNLIESSEITSGYSEYESSYIIDPLENIMPIDFVRIGLPNPNPSQSPVDIIDRILGITNFSEEIWKNNIYVQKGVSDPVDRSFRIGILGVIVGLPLEGEFAIYNGVIDLVELLAPGASTVAGGSTIGQELISGFDAIFGSLF